MTGNRASQLGQNAPPLTRRKLLEIVGIGVAGSAGGCLGGGGCEPPESGADRSGCDFDGWDLSARDLSAAIFVGTDLSGADLSGSNLSGADLSNATLIEADLREADLTGAVLPDADLTDARADRAILADADLSEARLAGVSFVEANLEDADLSQVWGAEDAFEIRNRGPPPANPADFTDAGLARAVLEDSFLPGAIFVRTDLTGVRSSGAVYWRSEWRDAIARDADFTHTDIRVAQIDGTDFYGSDFTQSAFLSYGVCPNETCNDFIWDPDEDPEE